jgi:UDP-GlcNAc:undecaprenyl-phosphate GlcNAc-1-phosphate transferase
VIENIKSIAEYPLFLFFFTLIITGIILFFSYSIGFKTGLIDLPGGRKTHKKNIPLVGGLSIFISTSVILIPIFYQYMEYVAFWIACFLLFCIGLTDDKRDLTAKYRFIVQFLSICVIIFLGKTVVLDLGSLFGSGLILIGWVGVPFTCFALIGIINSVNMMDGVDGLTGCVSLVELGLMYFLASNMMLNYESVVILVFMGAILAFLFFNFPAKFLEKRKVFLGDAGSLLIGLILAWLTVRLTQGYRHCSPVLMLWIMALPLMDTVHLIINRKARGVSAFRADRRHIHHILLHVGYSPSKTSLILAAVSFLIGVLGIMLYMNGVSDWVLFLGVILLFCIYSRIVYGLKKNIGSRKYRLLNV